MGENERVRELRKSLNFTLEKFGAKLGVTKTAISNIERGERKLTDQMAKAICREFNVNYIWLKDGVGDMYNNVDHDLNSRFKKIMSGDDDLHKKLIASVVNMSGDEVVRFVEAVENIKNLFGDLNKKAD